MKFVLCRLLLVSMVAGIAVVAPADQFDPTGEIYSTDRMLMAIPPTRTPPQIDARIGDTEWDCASSFAGFYDYAQGVLLPDSPVAFLTCGTTHLYVLMIAPRERGRELVANATQQDGEVFRDDSVEMYFSTPNNQLFQFVVNSAGAVADFRNNDKTWNGSPFVKAGVAEGKDLPAKWGLPQGSYWFVEAAVPFSDMGISPRAGDKWLLNLAVNRPGKPWAVLAPLSGGAFADTKRYCSLLFLGAEDPYVQLTSYGNLRFGDLRVVGRLFNPSTKPINARLELDLRKQGSSLTKDAFRNVVGVIHPVTQALTVPPGASAPLQVEQEVKETIVNQMGWRVSVPQVGNPSVLLLVQHGSVRIEPPLIVQAGNVPSQKKVVLSLDTTGLKEQADIDRLPLTLQVLDSQGKALQEKEVTAPIGKSEHVLSYLNLLEGRYRCRVTALNKAKLKIATTEVSFNCLTPPVWLANTLYDDYGKADRVPLPWTPLRAAGKSVSVWGRTMRWDKSLLPSSIESAGSEMLRRPMQLVITLKGKDYSVPLTRFRITSRKNSRAEMIAEGTVQGLRVTAGLWVEFDGFMWVTLKLQEATKTRRVDALRVVVPMDARRTKLYQTFCRPLAGWLGKEPVKFAWPAMPGESTVNFYHWFGNEDKGLGFTFSSLQHWAPLSEDNFCTFNPGEREGVYRINLLEQPVTVEGRVFEFGLQATPIKPLPPDYHSMMAGTLSYPSWKVVQRLPENMDMTLVWPRPNGVTMTGLQDPYNINAAAMTDIVKHTRQKGLPFVGVANCPQKFCRLNKEFEDYRLEWEDLPESILNWENVPHYQNCGRSYSLRKWLFYGWAVENVQRFGLGGIYFDGWQAGTMACMNPHHGCGWSDDQGKRHLTVPVLEGREFNKRLILFLEDHVKGALPNTAPGRKGFPRYHLWIHSWEFVPSVMGFATEWLTGEFSGWPSHGPSMLTPEGTYGKCLGLGLFRARCLSTNWGVPNLFDALMWEHLENNPTDKQTLMAYAWFLPHGVPIGIVDYVNQNTVASISRIMMDFEIRKASFIPCWRENPFLKIVDPIAEEVMVATWDHRPQNRVLAVVSNLKVEEARDIVLRWTGFPNPRIKNARTGERLELKDGRLTVKLAPESFVLLQIEA